jgi:hypothetical protein
MRRDSIFLSFKYSGFKPGAAVQLESQSNKNPLEIFFQKHEKAWD